MDPASDSLKYIKNLEYDKYTKDEFYDYLYFDEKPHPSKRLEQELRLRGRRFYCPNCFKYSVKVSIDQDLFRDVFFVRAVCPPCDVYSFMEISTYALSIVDIKIFMKQMIHDVIEGLRDTSEFDLDAMIDKDWKLAGG